MAKNQCENSTCDNEAMYFDTMDNKMCSECVEFEIVECGNSAEDYEFID